MARINIYNPKTGETGFQIPGATLQPGWQWQGASDMSASAQSLPKTQPTVLSPDLAREDFNKKSNQLDKIVQENKPVTPTTKTEDTGGLSEEERGILDLKKELDADQKMIEDTYAAYAGQVDARTEQTISQIKTLKEGQVRDQKEANKKTYDAYSRFGLREGLKRYAPESTQGVLSRVEQEGMDKVNKIINEEASLISEAQAAREEKQFSVFQDKMTKLEAIRKEKRAELKKLTDAATEARKSAQANLVKATRESAILGLFSQGIKDPIQLFDMVNFSENGEMVGDITLEEIKGVLDKLKPAGEKLTGDYGEYVTLKEAGEFKGGFFDYVRKKKEAGTIKDTSGDGIAGGAVSGDVQRDADSIMAGVLDPSKLSTSKNYAATVMAEVAKRKAKAKESGDIVGIIRASAGGKDTEASFNTSFEKAVNVVGQIADLQRLFESSDKPEYKDADGNKKKLDMSPITGIWKSANPYDTKAQSIKAQLSAIVPNLARGIYGEVGVLTDNDVEIYSRTLPKLTSTEEVRNMVLGLTIRSIQRSIENKIKINANRDLTHLEDVYLEVKGQADKLLAPYEAMTAKDELEKMTLPATGSTATSSPDFWSKAP